MKCILRTSNQSKTYWSVGQCTQSVTSICPGWVWSQFTTCCIKGQSQGSPSLLLRQPSRKTLSHHLLFSWNRDLNKSLSKSSRLGKWLYFSKVSSAEEKLCIWQVSHADKKWWLSKQVLGCSAVCSSYCWLVWLRINVSTDARVFDGQIRQVL